MVILFSIVVIVVTGLLVFLFIRDRRYLKKPTRDALGRDLKQEIDREKRLYQTHKARFESALEKAKTRLIGK